MRKKYYDDAKENAAFERCVDVVTSLIFKYGPALKRKWILRDWIKNMQADYFWRSLACKLIIPGLSEPPVRTLGATFPEIESHVYR